MIGLGSGAKEWDLYFTSMDLFASGFLLGRVVSLLSSISHSFRQVAPGATEHRRGTGSDSFMEYNYPFFGFCSWVIFILLVAGEYLPHGVQRFRAARCVSLIKRWEAGFLAVADSKILPRVAHRPLHLDSAELIPFFPGNFPCAGFASERQT